MTSRVREGPRKYCKVRRPSSVGSTRTLPAPQDAGFGSSSAVGKVSEPRKGRRRSPGTRDRSVRRLALLQRRASRWGCHTPVARRQASASAPFRRPPPLSRCSQPRPLQRARSLARPRDGWSIAAHPAAVRTAACPSAGSGPDQTRFIRCRLRFLSFDPSVRIQADLILWKKNGRVSSVGGRPR